MIALHYKSCKIIQKGSYRVALKDNWIADILKKGCLKRR